VRRVRAELTAFGGADVAVIATGDSAPLIMPECETVEHHEPELTLEGLRLVYERNLARRGARRSEI
jgi:type III pantothenate kinase